jgi:hypothetical protein
VAVRAPGLAGVRHQLRVLLEPFLLRARAEELGLARVALTAHERDGLEARRLRAVIAVAVVARRGRQVLALQQELGMDAAPPARVLIDR